MNKRVSGKAKSKVQVIRSNSDWGGILFNACYVFNLHFADYWLSFSKSYDANGISDMVEKTRREIERLSERRREILDCIRRNQSVRLRRSKELADSRSGYVHSSLVGQFVESRRRYCDAQRSNDLIGMLSSMQGNKEYENAFRRRKENYDRYVNCMDSEDEETDDDQTVACAHRLLIKINALKKSLDRIGIPLAESPTDSERRIYEMLSSEAFAERLMGVCINILKTYSENDFFSRLTEYGREMTANLIYDSFNGFEHNYDFLCGFYDLKEDGLLHLRDEDTMKGKIYNGYYLTIRGFVQRAYSHARNESILTSSLDQKDDDEDRGMHETIGESDSCGGNGSSLLKNFDEGMIRYWKECHLFLESKIDEMSLEMNRRRMFFSQEIGSAFNNVDDTPDFFRRLLSSMDRELSAGRFVRSKFRHLVLDAMLGASSTKEWDCQTKCSREVIGQFLKVFFVREMSLLGNDELTEGRLNNL